MTISNITAVALLTCFATAASGQLASVATQRTKADQLKSGPSPLIAARTPVLKPLWVKNEKTGQVIRADRFTFQNRSTTPVTVLDNYSAPNAVSGINLNWNYPEAYTNPNFTAPTEGPDLLYGAINIASDPSDLSDPTLRAGDEKLSIVVEPWTATDWPGGDLNVRHKLTDYSSVVASYSEEFEIRLCRVTFFSLKDVNAPFDPVSNRYELDVALQFAFLSFPFQAVESPFAFDLSDFDPPIAVKGKGLVMTHWLQLAEPPPCYPDQNGDTLVDDADFQMFIVQYDALDCSDPAMPFACVGDLNFDGFVDDLDFQIFVVAYDTLLCPGGSVVRKVYAPLAGGRFKWNTTTNTPFGVVP